MPVTKKLPEPIGALILDQEGLPKERIPIFGMNEVQLARNANWTSQVGFQAMSIHTWIGSNPMVFNFNFTLAAGVHSRGTDTKVMTREDLAKKVRIAHAMVSHLYDGKKVTSPPRCMLIMGGLVNAVGYVNEMNCNGQAPWSLTPAGQGDVFPVVGRNTGTGMYPTLVTFSGSFTALPGYKSNAGVVEISDTNEKMSAQRILEHGYDMR